MQECVLRKCSKANTGGAVFERCRSAFADSFSSESGAGSGARVVLGLPAVPRGVRRPVHCRNFSKCGGPLLNLALFSPPVLARSRNRDGEGRGSVLRRRRRKPQPTLSDGETACRCRRRVVSNASLRTRVRGRALKPRSGRKDRRARLRKCRRVGAAPNSGSGAAPLLAGERPAVRSRRVARFPTSGQGGSLVGGTRRVGDSFHSRPFDSLTDSFRRRLLHWRFIITRRTAGSLLPLADIANKELIAQLVNLPPKLQQIRLPYGMFKAGSGAKSFRIRSRRSTGSGSSVLLRDAACRPCQPR